jgi:lipopolysaccharide export system protein LptA
MQVPYFDSGNLQMVLKIGVATRLDEERVQMEKLRLETFADGESEMVLTLPSAVLSISTGVIRAECPVSIRRSDLEVTGSTLIFDTTTRRGKIGGGVRLLIFNLVSFNQPGGVKQGTSAEKRSVPTEITALDLDLNNQESTGVFTGNVQVLDAEFHLSSDKLTAFLRKAPSKQRPQAQGSKAPLDAVRESSETREEKEGTLEKAVAEASGENWVVITQNKPEPDGSLRRSTGRGKKAVYDSKTGGMTLTEWPSLEHQQNTIEATRDNSVITLNRSGELLGEHTRTTLLGEKGPTVITALRVKLNNKESTCVFTGDVQLLATEGRLSCDKLTAFLPKAPSKERPAAKGSKTPRNAARASSQTRDERDGTLEKAVAEASGENWVMITQDKPEPDGSLSRSTGRGKRAVYDSKTGDITLTEWPSLEHKQNTMEATRDNSVITLNRNGEMLGEQTRTTLLGEKGPTVITALRVRLNNKESTCVFTGDVQVLDAEFRLSCDKLTAFLPKAPSKERPTAKGSKTPRNAARASSQTRDEREGTLEKAVAEASGENWVMITQDKPEPDGSLSRSTGRGKKAVYDSKTGNMTLTGWPSIQQKQNTMEATRESSVITLNRNGVATGKHLEGTFR